MSRFIRNYRQHRSRLCFPRLRRRYPPLFLPEFRSRDKPANKRPRYPYLRVTHGRLHNGSANPCHRASSPRYDCMPKPLLLESSSLAPGVIISRNATSWNTGQCIFRTATECRVREKCREREREKWKKIEIIISRCQKTFSRNGIGGKIPHLFLLFILAQFLKCRSTIFIIFFHP